MLGQTANLAGQATRLLSITSWDLLILLFLVIISAGYTFLFVNRGKIVPFLVATYIAYVLIELAPFLGQHAALFGFGLFQAKIIGFAVIFLLILFILSRVIFQSPVGVETFGLPASFLMALSQTGFLLAVLLSFFPVELTSQFSGLVRALFLGNHVLFYWALAPVVVLLIFGRKANLQVG